MTVRFACFARIREIVGADAERGFSEGATAADAYAALVREFPALRDVAAATRFVRDGAFVAADVPLRDGDELGLLPPYGGG